MLRKILSLLALVIALAIVQTAQAGTLSYSGYTVVGPQNVTLSGVALGHTESAAAGEITLLGINGGTGALSTFCIDVADWLTPSGQFSTGTYLTGSLADQINALLTHVLPTLGTNRNSSAALQVAIWKTEYGANLTVSGNDDVIGLADEYLGNVHLGHWTADRSMRVAVLNGGGADQSQAYLAPVPEPASLALLGMVLFCAAVWRHRRSARMPNYCWVTTRSINCRPARPDLS